jgi:hypothetical protein
MASMKSYLLKLFEKLTIRHWIPLIVLIGDETHNWEVVNLQMKVTRDQIGFFINFGGKPI